MEILIYIFPKKKKRTNKTNICIEATKHFRTNNNWNVKNVTLEKSVWHILKMWNAMFDIISIKRDINCLHLRNSKLMEVKINIQWWLYLSQTIICKSIDIQTIYHAQRSLWNWFQYDYNSWCISTFIQMVIVIVIWLWL